MIAKGKAVQELSLKMHDKMGFVNSGTDLDFKHDLTNLCLLT